MRVVVVGATGNVGSSLVRLLAEEPEVESIVGVARRRPALELPKTTWEAKDIRFDDLAPVLEGADAVVHLAWAIQPSHNPKALASVNVLGSSRVFEAAAQASVPALVYASSVGAYAPGPKDRFVDETWPVRAVPTSFYARHKVEVERRLDVFERRHPGVRVVRLRPGLIFKREAAEGVRRLFAGPFLPTPLLRPGLVTVVPDLHGLRFQGVHSFDVADAYRRAIVREVEGAFNLAADPVIDPSVLAGIFRARKLRLPAGAARLLVDASWRMRLQPTPPGWFDLALAVPLLDSSRARAELGWAPARRADEALREILDGMRRGVGDRTPTLEPRSEDMTEPATEGVLR